MPPASVAAIAASMMHNNHDRDPEDLRIPTSSPFGSHMGHRGAMGHAAALAAAHASSQGAGMGSALLDTYLSMIAAAGCDSNTMAAALGSFPGAANRAAAFAAASQIATSTASTSNRVKPAALNGDGKEASEGGRSASEDQEDDVGSDADISDTEDGGGHQEGGHLETLNIEEHVPEDH
jgi:hypothetical protein